MRRMSRCWRRLYHGAPKGRALITAIDGQDPVTGAAVTFWPDVVVDANAKALYDAIHDRSPHMIEAGEGLTLEWTPPALFGQIG